MKPFLYIAGLALCAVLSAQTRVNCAGPLALDDVVELLQGDVPPLRMLQYVTTCGVSFQLNASAERRIRAARGTDALISAIREKAPPKQKPAAPGAPKVGDYRDNEKDGQRYLWIPPGSFTMGCSPGDNGCSADEKPHPVEISNGFWLGRTEVTAGTWKRYARKKGKEMLPAPGFNASWYDDTQPMVNISWDDSEQFCKWAGGRLPTEAEWEYAARAGSSTPYYGELRQIAWYRENNSSNGAHSAGEKQANAWGLHDMLGNVWEWVNDWYNENYYASSPRRDPQGPARATGLRVLRGASWSSRRGNLRVSSRNGVERGYRSSYIGCRCAWD